MDYVILSMDVNKTLHYWDIIWMLAKTDLKMRYQGSWLGAIWVFLKPFCLFLVMNFVFSHMFGSVSHNYSIRLFMGLILWSFFAETTTVGMNSLMSKAGILKKVFIPKWTIIISATIHSALAFLFNLIILFLFLFFYYHLHPEFILVLLFLVYVILIYGIALIFSFLTAPIFVKVRDMNQLWEVILQVLFFASPIIYPFSALPKSIQPVLFFNPMTLIIEHSRMLLIDNAVPRLDHLIIFIVLFIPCLLGSILWEKKFSVNIIEKM